MQEQVRVRVTLGDRERLVRQRDSTLRFTGIDQALSQQRQETGVRAPILGVGHLDRGLDDRPLFGRSLAVPLEPTVGRQRRPDQHIVRAAFAASSAPACNVANACTSPARS